MFQFDFTSTVIKWEGKAAWHFIPLPPDLSREIDELCGDLKGGWGSLPVQVRIGTTVWRTSIFPDKSRGTYLLPLKAEVRRERNLGEGDSADVELTV